MFGKVLAFAALVFLFVPSGNGGGYAAPAPLNDTAGIAEIASNQAYIDSVNRVCITDSVISICKQSLGLPYKYGGNSCTTGFDCSHFVAYGFGKLGINIPASSAGLSTTGEQISLDSVQKGDILLFKGRNINATKVGHVALVIEVGPGVIRMIHSCSRGVVIDNYYDMKYYTARFLQARRIKY
jgi:cell wall-associated NlpC family hydrolase